MGEPRTQAEAAAGTGAGGTWAAFLVVTFAVAGLAGLFAIYAAQLPFQRGLASDGLLDQVVVAGAAGDQAALDRLRPALGPQADAILSGPGNLVDRVATARTQLHGQVLAAAADIRTRLLIVVSVVTAACALFGTMLLSIVRRSRSPG